MIGQSIELHVLKTGKNKVVLGLSAPADVHICRSELPQQPLENKEELLHVSLT
jgi:carbon storage regulator CsrA